METLDVAFLGLGKAGESLEDLDGGLSIDGAAVGLSVIGEGDTLSTSFQTLLRPGRAYLASVALCYRLGRKHIFRKNL